MYLSREGKLYIKEEKMDKIQKPSFSDSNNASNSNVVANQQNYGDVKASVPGTANGTAQSHPVSEINSTWNKDVMEIKRRAFVDGKVHD